MARQRGRRRLRGRAGSRTGPCRRKARPASAHAPHRLLLPDEASTACTSPVTIEGSVFPRDCCRSSGPGMDSIRAVAPAWIVAIRRRRQALVTPSWNVVVGCRGLRTNQVRWSGLLFVVLSGADGYAYHLRPYSVVEQHVSPLIVRLRRRLPVRSRHTSYPLVVGTSFLVPHRCPASTRRG